MPAAGGMMATSPLRLRCVRLAPRCLHVKCCSAAQPSSSMSSRLSSRSNKHPSQRQSTQMLLSRTIHTGQAGTSCLPVVNTVASQQKTLSSSRACSRWTILPEPGRPSRRYAQAGESHVHSAASVHRRSALQGPSKPSKRSTQLRIALRSLSAPDSTLPRALSTPGEPRPQRPDPNADFARLQDPALMVQTRGESISAAGTAPHPTQAPPAVQPPASSRAPLTAAFLPMPSASCRPGTARRRAGAAEAAAPHHTRRQGGWPRRVTAARATHRW